MMSETEVVALLNYLVEERSRVNAESGLCALLFLHEYILMHPLEKIMDFKRASRPKKLPVVLSVQEVKQELDLMDGVPKMIAQILYGVGLRVSECLRLRVLDIDFCYNQIQVRSGKGIKDHITIMSQIVKPKLKLQIERV